MYIEKHMYLSNNNLDKIDEIPNNTEYLDCSGNKLTEINFNFKNLQYLNCRFNPLKN